MKKLSFFSSHHTTPRHPHPLPSVFEAHSLPSPPSTLTIMISKILLPILLLASDDVVLVSAFLRAAPSSPSTTTTATRRPHHHHHHRRHHRIVAAPSRASTANDDEDIGGSLSESGSGGGRRRGDNGAMSFLRKMGRVGGAANMDFANALGLDESPSGGTKTAHHEGGFKVSLSPRDTAISDEACSPRPPLPFLERCRHFSIVPSSISTPVARDHPPPERAQVEGFVRPVRDLRHNRRHVRSLPVHVLWFAMARYYRSRHGRIVERVPQSRDFRRSYRERPPWDRVA